MKVKAIFKNTYREIFRSPGRFFAILTIIILGSGFLVGLRVSRNAMIETARDYLNAQNFYDFSVASTLGMTDDDVDALADLDGVNCAEGTFESDAFVLTDGGNEQVCAIYTLPTLINVPDVIEGRLPENAGECIIDENSSSGQIGSTITVSGSNDEDTLELFATREFTIVGRCTSPLYMNYERGGTSLGDGSISAFIYVMPDVFDTDYYTGVYISMEDMPEAYSDEYETRYDELEPIVTALAEERADIRYNDVVSDANDELQDGIDEYNDGLDEYQTERADAEEELADAWQELEDAAAELEDAETELADAKKELDDAAVELADAETELNDAKAELDDAKQTLDDAAAELADAKQQIDDAEKEISDGWQELADSEAEARKTLEDAQTELAAAYDTLTVSEQEYEASLAEYNSGLSQYEDGLSQYEDGAAQLEASKSQLDTSYETLTAQQATFDTLMDTIAQGVAASGFPGYDGTTLLAALNSGDETAIMVTDSALAAMAAYDGSVPVNTDALLASYASLQAGWTQYNEGLAAYNSASSELAVSKATLDATKTMLDNAKVQLDEGRAELDSGWADYNAGVAEVESGYDELETSLADGRKTLEDAEAELEDAKAEYENGVAEYEDGLAEYEDGKAEYEDGVKEYEDAKAEYEDGLAEYEDGLKEYEDGKAEYEDGLKEYEDAKQEAYDGFDEAETELADAWQEIEDARKEIEDIEYPTVYVLGRWSNVGYVCFENDSMIVENVSKVFPLFFFLIAALICLTTITRMVDEQRSQLGVLMALGYSNTSIMSKFLIYSGTATVIGCVVGILLGSWAIPLVIWQAYQIMYHFSNSIVFYFDVPLSTVTFAAYLVSMLFVTWYSCKGEINETPANIIRPKPPKTGKRVLLERVGFIWNHLSFMWKVSVRNMFRYKARALMMILGVAGCTALMITGFGINDSINGVADLQYEGITLYDMTVSFSDGLDESEKDEFLNSVSGYEDVLFLNQSSVTAVFGKNEKEVTINVYSVEDSDRISKFEDYHVGDTPLDFPDENEVLLNNALADALNVSVGDTITVRTDDGDMALQVSGIYDYYIYNYICVSSEAYSSQLGTDAEINTAFVNAEDKDTASYLAADILKLDDVLTVSEVTVMRERIESMLSSLVYIVILTIVCAAALAFTVIYNLTNINITERLREIATVKVLGFYDSESASYVLRENVVMTIIGAIAGIPMGIALNAFVMSQINVDLIRFTPTVKLPSFIYSLAFTMVFSLLVDFFMYFKLNRINTAEALKAAE